ncbi:MAG: hypothetical protein QW035_01970 [Candidatus Anstonellales archaeon]
MMGKHERVSTKPVQVEKGYLYYLANDGYVWRVPMKHNKGGRKLKVGSEYMKKEAGWLYFVKTDGHVYRVKMKNA